MTRYMKLIWGLKAYQQGLRMLLACKNPGILQRNQSRDLRRLVQHARTNVAYYRTIEAFKLIDVMSPDFEQQFKRLPILRRATIVNRFADLVADSVGHAVVGFTSGSTGSPMKFLKDLSRRPRQDGSVLRRKILTKRSLLLEKVAYLANIPGLKSSPFVWRQGLGKVKTFYIEDPDFPDSLLIWKPSALAGWPDSLRWAADRLKESGRSLKVPHVISHSSVLDDFTRKKLESDFGAVVIDEYGLNETGDVASTMCRMDHLHIDSELFYVEVLDEHGASVADGEQGEVVITVLHNFAFPLVRYATGDLACMSRGPFKCGIALPVLTWILGRKDDMIVLANGRQLTMGKMNLFFWGTTDLRQWRIYVESPERVIVECQWCEHVGEKTKETMLKELHKLFGEETEIQMVETVVSLDEKGKPRHVIKGQYPKAIIDCRWGPPDRRLSM